MIGRPRDRGVSGMEYAAAILVAAAVIGTLLVVIPNQATPSVKAAICRLFSDSDCGRPDNGARGPSGTPVTRGPAGSTGPVGPVGPVTDETPEEREFREAQNALNQADQETNAAQQAMDAFSLWNELKNLGLEFLFGDISKCIGNPNLKDCLWAIVGLLPWGKIGKFVKSIPKLVKLGDKFLTLKRRLEKARKSRKDTKDRLDRALDACKNKKPGNSFLPGTPVLLADGSSRPIQDIKAGDRVWATDPATGRRGPRPVTALITGTGRKQLVDVTIDPDGQLGGSTTTLTATANHPFHSPTAGRAGLWLDADELVFGDQLTTPTGHNALVLAARSRTAPAQRVHNLTIADLHTYHVLAGSMAVLVHNAGPCTISGFKHGIDPDEITDLNRTFGGETELGGTPMNALINAGRYNSFWEKSASLIRNIAGDHMFNNGNKRTAQAVIETLMQRNGITTGPSSAELRAVILKVAKGQMTEIDDIAAALRGY